MQFRLPLNSRIEFRVKYLFNLTTEHINLSIKKQLSNNTNSIISPQVK